MEVFQGLSASLQVGITLWALWEKATTFLDQAHDVDETFHTLKSIVESWKNMFASVMEAVKGRLDFYVSDPSPIIPTSERDVIERIFLSLEDGDKALKVLSATIQSIRVPCRSILMSQNDFIRKCKDQLRLNGQKDTLAKLMAKLDRQREMIETHLITLLT
jgi:hypothetical protein